MSAPTWSGGRLTGWGRCILAPNPGPMTLDGTNTYLLGRPGAEVYVVDPGPAHAGHLRAVQEAATGEGSRVLAVLLTHAHADHSEGAAELARALGVPVRALDPRHRLGPELGLPAGLELRAEGLRIQVVPTPGHTADSVSFLVHGPSGPPVLLTGDTVLGRGTSVVAAPEGRLGAYLDSLQRLARASQAERVAAIWPGHGPVRTDPGALLEHYLAHRQDRLAQVRAAVADGARTPAEVVDVVYAGLDPDLRPAAELSARAQLEHLGVPAQD